MVIEFAISVSRELIVVVTYINLSVLLDTHEVTSISLSNSGYLRKFIL